MSGAIGKMELIGLDWGLTRLRVYCIGPGGRILQQRDSERGILTVRDKNFAGAVRPLIADWLAEAPHLPVFLCGMIGSRNGWHEAPYSPCPASLREVARNSLPIDVEGRSACLVGGLSFTDRHGQHDVIRGEETQIFGAAAQEGAQLIVTPGTHSKWAVVREGIIESFRTYMTGELYAVLSEHSSLGWWTKEAQESVKEEDSFVQGVHAVLADPDLLHALFTVRTRALFEERPPAAHAAYLSGILIGNEVARGLPLESPQAITLIASPKFANLYRLALSAAGVHKVECIDGDRAVARGLWRIAQLRGQKL